MLGTTIHKQTQENVNKTYALLQTTEGKDEPNIVFFTEIVTDITTRNSQCNLSFLICCSETGFKKGVRTSLMFILPYNIIHLLTGYEGNSTFIVPKVLTIFRGNRGDN